MAEFKAAVADFICNDVARVLLALALVLGTLVLLIMGKPVPDVLWTLDGAALAFYFSIAAVKSSLR